MALQTIFDGGVSAEINTLGAELSSLKFEGREYIWQADPTYWSRHAPVLFPIVGSLKDGKAVSEAGEINLSRHGFARDMEFEIVEKTQNSITLELESNETTRKIYPYYFMFQMTYSINEDGDLLQLFSITNTGDVVLPASFGGHPAFNVPVDPADNEDFSDYKLSFTQEWSAKTPTLTKDGIFDFSKEVTLLDNEDVLKLTHETFDIDTLVFHNVPDDCVSLGGPAGHGVALIFPDFPYLGVWSAPNAPFVAVEPWCGLASATDEDEHFEHKRGMEYIDPHETLKNGFIISVY